LTSARAAYDLAARICIARGAVRVHRLDVEFTGGVHRELVTQKFEEPLGAVVAADRAVGSLEDAVATVAVGTSPISGQVPAVVLQ